MTFETPEFRGMAGIVVLLFFLSTSLLSAQTPIEYKPGFVQTAGSEFNAASRGTGPVHIVAVMVEFQPDDNRFTTGNGTFHLDYLDSPDIIIDPLPHDRGYFEAHLEFVRNYFETVSGNVLQLSYEVLPEVVRLGNEMKEYAPLGEDNTENFRLARLYHDTWTAVREQMNPDFNGYDPDRTAFVIFHAGAGRDIELTGTTLDKTPQDIPSVYLDLDALSRLLDEPGYQGIDMGNGFRITNSSILPQTQSRPGEDITGTPFVVQLSINGILTGTIGSYLGLPDLFNTLTGASGIGRFGLMDGESFFSLGGVFPPEPSAWEKIHMGWAGPVDIDLNNPDPVMLPAAVLRQPGSIVRHRISSDEYFLVENRHRDPGNDGVQITVRTPAGEYITRTITNADSLESKIINSISRPDRLRDLLPPGVITNVSNFDWALPGGQTERDDGSTRLLNGGMLIWHIDEAVIRSEMGRNRVNANVDRRGVRVVEADGAQDIGRESLTFADYGRGSAFDFWWSGNDFTVITQTGQRIIVYENRFADNTQPDNRSNTGSPTFFEFFDFSGNVPLASFRARPAAADWFGQLELGAAARLNIPSVNRQPYYRDYPLALSLFRNGPADPLHLIIPSENGVLAIDISTVTTAAGSPVSESTSASTPASNALKAPATPTIPITTSDSNSPSTTTPVTASTPTPTTTRGSAATPVSTYTPVPTETSVSAYTPVLAASPVSTITLTSTSISTSTPVIQQFNVPWPSQPLPGRNLVITGSPDAPVQGPTRAFSYSGGIWTESWQNSDITFTAGLISSERGDTVEFDLTRNRLLIDDGSSLPSLPEIRQRGKLLNGFRPVISGTDLILSDGTTVGQLPVTDGRIYTGTINPAISSAGFFLLTGQQLTLYPRDRDPVTFNTPEAISWPVFLDLDDDGSLDLFYVNYGANRLEGRNLNGGSHWYFPLVLPEGRRIAGPPVVADLTGDEQPEFIIPVQDSLSLTLYGYDIEMRPLPGFPLYVGSVTGIGHLPVHPVLTGNRLFAISHTGDLKGWVFPGMGRIWWGGHYGNEDFNKVAGRLESEGQAMLPFGLLNADETYNWPNPADTHTHIRFQTSRNARIEITVITYSGDTFFKKNLDSSGGLPEDIYLDTSSWGNGVYFARVTARSEGTTETRMFKIGVMH
jgi:hypothetical protein